MGKRLDFWIKAAEDYGIERLKAWMVEVAKLEESPLRTITREVYEHAKRTGRPCQMRTNRDKDYSSPAP